MPYRPRRAEGPAPTGLRRRHLLAALSLPLPLPLATGCAGLGLPRSTTLTEAELTDLLSRQFPRTEVLAGLLELTLSEPRLWLLPQRNRLGVGFALRARERLTNRSLPGRLALDAGLRFEPSDASVRLSQVQVQQLQFDGGEGGGPLDSRRVGALLAERLLENLAVHRLKPQQVQRLQAAGLTQASLAVTARGLEIALAP